MDLASKDSYIQKLASKVISQHEQEPKKRPFAHFKGKTDTGPPQKKKKCKKKNFKEKGVPPPKSTRENRKQKPPPSAAVQKGPAAAAKLNGSKPPSTNGSTTATPKGGIVKSSFSTVDVLRKRLHEKIEESRGQGNPKDALSEEVQAKRAKRKLERERKKRKRKEFRLKKLAEKNAEEQPEIKQEVEPAPTPAANKRNEAAILFNKVETVEERYVDKIQKKKDKKKSVKGQLTPLVGRNYKQLLGRVEARKAKLEQLRETDEGKAREYEEKMKWTNILYKAEGLKIKDDEDMLRTSLRKKEKNRDTRKKNWGERSENIVKKMEHRQDKRRKNLQRRKVAKTEKKKTQARKRGRILPEDLK